jgi:hypothetical protein
MLKAWLGRVTDRDLKKRRIGRAMRSGKLRFARPQLEQLEDLTLLSVTNNWTGAGHDGLWKDANNWSLGVPVAGQDIAITNVNSTSSVTLDNSLGTVSIDSLTTSVAFNLVSGAQLLTTGGGSVSAGGVTLQGGVTFAIQGGSTLAIDGGSQSITGSGNVTFDSNASNQLVDNDSGTLTIGSGITINGQNGSIGGNYSSTGPVTIINNGTIDASVDGGTLTLGPQATGTTTVEGGTIEATSGGTLVLAANVTTSAMITTDPINASTVEWDNNSITGSEITGVFAPVKNATCLLDGVTVGTNGVLDMTSVQGQLQVQDGLTLNGIAAIRLGNSIQFLGTQTLSGTGFVYFEDTSTNNALSIQASPDSTATLTIGSNILISGTSGTIGSSSGGNVAVVLDGTIDADVFNGTITVDPNGGITNNGGLKAAAGTLIVDAPLTNYNASSGTLTGGSYIVGSTMQLEVPAGIQTDDAQITFEGSAGTIENFSTGTDALTDTLTTIGPDDDVVLMNGKILNLAHVNVTDNGYIDIDGTGGPSQLLVGGLYVGGGTGLLALTSGGTLSAGLGTVKIGGLLQGTGTINAATLINVGNIYPGFLTTTGTITVNAAYQQQSIGSLDIELGGTVAGTQYDQLIVNGSASLAGYVSIAEEAGFSPQLGNSFKILQYSSFSGDFQTREDFYLGGGRIVDEQIVPTSLSLVVNQATLSFTSAVTSTVAGLPLGPMAGIQVDVLDTNGQVIASDNSDHISLSLNKNSLVGGGSISVVNGVATFSGVDITTASTGYQISAVCAGFANGLSTTFTISPDGITKLVFSGEPTNAGVGATLAPVTVAEEDQYNNIETGDNSSSISLALSPNSNDLSGTIPQTVQGGVATFSDLKVSQAGTGYILKASTSSFNAASTAFNIATVSTTTAAASESGSAGQSVTLQATITAVGSTAIVNEGSVNFDLFNGTTQIGSTATSATVAAGVASATFTVPANTPLGSYTVKAFYTDPTGLNFSSSQSDPNSNGTLSVVPASTTTTATNSSASFSTSTQTISLSATVLSGNSAVNEGTVTFTLLGPGNLPIGSAVTSGTVAFGNANVSYTLPAGQQPGTYTIQAVYNPGTDYLASSDSNHALTIGNGATSTNAVSATTSFSTGSQSVLLSATVTSGSAGVNGGTVTFTVLTAGNVQVGVPTTTGTVTAGNASVRYNLPSGVPAGTYTIQAVYNPGTDYSTSSDSTHTLTISPATTTIGAGNDVTLYNPASYTATLDATVTSNLTGVSEGTITFTLLTPGGTQLGQSVTSGTLSGGTAFVGYTIPANTPSGTYTIEAVYNPGPDYQASSSSTATYKINVATTTTTATNATATFSASSQSVTLSARVSSGSGVVNEGTVTFTVFAQGGGQVGSTVTSGTVSNGNASATFTLPAGQAAGTYTIQTNYSPGPDFQASADSTHTLTVAPASSSTTTTNASAAFSAASQSLTLSANVTSGGSGINEGTVTFTVFTASHVQVGQSVTSATVSNGAATASFTLPASQSAGTYSIDAVYNPGADYQSSTDSSHVLTISQSGTTTTATNGSAVYDPIAHSVTLSATVTSGGVGVNEGTLTYSLYLQNNVVGSPTTSGTLVNGIGAVSYLLPAGLNAGTYVLQAQYNSGADFTTSVDTSHSFVITQGTSSTTVSNAQAAFSATQQSVTLTASVSSGGFGVNEGAVTFTILTAGNVAVGSPVTSSTVSGGSAEVSYPLPAGTLAGTYVIQAQYNDTNHQNLQSSADSTHTLLIAAATTTTANSSTAFFNSVSQIVALQAGVTSNGGTVDEGTITFTVLDSHNNQIGSPVTSGIVSNDSANASFTVPAGTPAGTYTIEAQYNDSNSGFYLQSTDFTHTLVVQPASTSIAAASTSASFSSSGVSVPVNATLSSPAGTIGEGVVTFSILNGSRVIGGPVASNTVSGGVASATITLPSGVGPGTYSIEAQYSDATGNFQTTNNSTSLASLTLSAATTTTSVTAEEIAGSSATQNVTLEASVSSAGGAVTQGTVTFVVLAGQTPLASPVTSGVIASGIASAVFQLPANTPVGRYTIQATFSGSTDYLAGSPATNTLIVDGAPILPEINGNNTITGPHNTIGSSSVALGASSPVGSSLNFAATVLGDSLLFDLQQQYQFHGLGYFTASASAYVLQANGNNSFGNPYYLLRPSDGALFAYDGSGSYAHSFAGTAIDTLGVNVYTDPTLLLNAQPPVDYPTVYNLEQQYHFGQVGSGYYTAGATAFVVEAASVNNFGNRYYLLSPTGAVYAYDGSGSYAHTFANVTPLASLDPEVYSHPGQLLGAQVTPAVYAQLAQLQQQYDLQEFNDSFYYNTYGNQAEWIYSPVLNQYGEHWYTLTPDGSFRAWEGYMDSATGAVVATLPTSVYSNPTLLTGATAVPAPAGVTASVDASGNLTVNSSSYIGTFRVKVTASDGFLVTSQTAIVDATGSNPTLSIQSNSVTIPKGSTQTVNHESFPAEYSVAATGAAGDTVTTTASYSSYSLPFSLEQQYRFQGLGIGSAGATAFVLQAAGNNSFGNPYYLLSSTGGLYAYDGSGSYAHTFANVTPMANLGAVTYADPSLLLNAQPPVNYSQLYSLQQQYQFRGLAVMTAGATAFVLQASANNSFGNPYYLLSPAGGIYAYDGSGSYAHTFANVTPIATVDPGVFVNPVLLTTAVAAPGLYVQLQSTELQYDLLGVGYYIAGAPAFVLTAPVNNANGNPYYLLSTNGSLYAYDGSGSYAHTFANSANLIASFDASVYNNPALLAFAKAPLAATGVSATIANGTLTLNAPSSFVGNFQVSVTATDANLTTSQSFIVSSTDTPPPPSTVANQSISLSSPTQTVTLGPVSGGNGALSYSAVGVAYSPEYTLQQQYKFTGLGRVTTADGVTAYVLQINAMNPNGNPYYLLSSTGGLFAYDGSGSFGHTIANNANLIAQLSASDYNTPTLLTNAQPPIMTPAIQHAVGTPVGNQLTINVTGLSVGTIFEVLVTVSDGAETRQSSFVVTVTA